jgi:hypothetical protein
MVLPPVVFFVFNRPEPTARVLARIREVRPSKLFVVADGPRPDRPDDAALCRQVRAIIDQGVDWPCEVVRDYADCNMGSGPRIATGLTQVFTRVEEAIILEDDCLPEPTFFRYCAELLEKYRNEPRVAMISGSHHQVKNTPAADDYYFCRYGNTWGWATWRRAWQFFDYDMRDWPAWRESGELDRLFPDPAVRAYWRRIWDETAAGKHDAWDYQWTFAYMRRGMLGILPRVALIWNIGFGRDATHTAGEGGGYPQTSPASFPLRHPPSLEPDLVAEAAASRRFFTPRSLWQRVRAKVGRWRAQLPWGN